MKRMTICFVVILLLLPLRIAASGIYSNGTASEDSISLSLYITDSLGNPSLAAADSFYISVIGPSGDSILALGGTAATAGLNIDSMETVCFGWQYIYSQAISEIDGSGRAGTYELTFCAKDNSPKYINCARTTFQITTTHLSDQLAAVSTVLDSVLAVLDSLRSQDNWVSSFDPALDTVLSDVAKISGDASAADNLETMLDGTGGKKLSLAGLKVQALNNDTAVTIKASGTGTGLGLYVLGGGNGGEGVKIAGGNTKSALVAEGGTTIGATHGFDLVGAGSGFGLNASFSSAARQALADAVWDEDTTGHQTAGSFAEMLKDTSAYQGSASGLTAANVADSVWGHLLDISWPAGSFGDSASGWGAGSSSGFGFGTYPVTITAYDDASDQVVPGVRLGVYNSNMDALIALGLTGLDGGVGFNLDSGVYVISAFSPGYIYQAYDTLSVTGSICDTVYGYRFDPGSPASPDLCRVYGYLYGIDGQALEGATVTAQITDGVVRHGSIIISPYKKTTVTDSAGYFFIDLIPSPSLNPVGTAYLISATGASGTIMKKTLAVPDSSIWMLEW